VVDIGGGSTELVLGSTSGGPDAAVSLDMGSVRMHERHLHSDPPTPDEVLACAADIDRHLDRSPVRLAEAATVVGVGGTVTTVGAGVLDLTSYDRDLVDQAVLRVEEVHDLADRLLAMPHAERLDLPWLHPGRADVIGAGALILDRVLRRTGVPTLVVSEADILDGIAWSLV
jgi:exopolyphosphatase/guanosine-5'-triphosphate,3'-diphosphate pyrophosphatase